ncbi:tetratricopeptide repeat protein [Streptomyces coelicoflavus]|uniref:tetratricopeptide repeat protein n=1 Tax=Streptomyces coelicoflavus TaxID=285562 RepID=UPI00369B3EB4
MRQDTLARLKSLYRAGRYEEAEAGARALASAPRGFRRRPAPQWRARALATGTAVAHGRGSEVLAELETLIAELEPVVPEVHVLQLVVRSNRTVVLLGQERYEEAEAEALDILRGVTRLAHLTPLWRLELHVLDNLARALCGRGRHEEAEAIARGNLPRADERSVGALHATLVHSLNGQHRYEEALAVARRFTPAGERADSGRLDLVVGAALYGLGRRDEAEAAVRQALSDCERNLHPDHARTREARALLGAVTGEKQDPGE